MIKISISVCIDAAPKQVWNALTKLEDIQLWSSAVRHAKCPEGKEYGKGAERICHLNGNIILHEKWVAWQENHSFTYEGTGLPMIKVATNKWTISPDNGKTLLLSEATILLKGGIFGRILEPIFKIMIGKMSPRAFASFKYFAENGLPYSGRSAELILPPSVC